MKYSIIHGILGESEKTSPNVASYVILLVEEYANETHFLYTTYNQRINDLGCGENISRKSMYDTLRFIPSILGIQKFETDSICDLAIELAKTKEIAKDYCNNYFKNLDIVT